jgi:hypothetical protein
LAEIQATLEDSQRSLEEKQAALEETHGIQSAANAASQAHEDALRREEELRAQLSEAEARGAQQQQVLDELHVSIATLREEHAATLANLDAASVEQAKQLAALEQELANAREAAAQPAPAPVEDEADFRDSRVTALMGVIEGTPLEEEAMPEPENPQLRQLRESLAQLEAERQRLAIELNQLRGDISEREVSLSDRNEAIMMAQNEAQALRDELRSTLVKLNAAQQEAREAMHRLNEAINAQGRAEDSAREARDDASRLRITGAGFDALINDDEVARQRILISSAKMGEGKHPLGQLLLDAGVISERQLDDVLTEQRRAPGRMLGTLLMDKEIASEEAVAQAIACQTNLPLVRPREQTIEKGAADMLRRDVCAWHVVIPLRVDAERIVLAMANPLDETALNKVRDLTRKEVVPVVATPSDILAAIEDCYGAF